MAFEILARLGLNATGFQSGLKRAESSGAAFAKTIKTQLAGAFTAAAAVQFVRSVHGAMDALGDLSDQSGLTVKDLQEFQAVAGKSGLDVNPLIQFIEKLREARREAQAGKPEMRDLFNQLNIDPTKLDALDDAGNLFRSFASEFAKFDQNSQNAIAQAIGGTRAGGRLSSTIKAIGQGAKSGEIQFSDTEVKAAGEIDNAVKSAGRQAKVAYAKFLSTPFSGILGGAFALFKQKAKEEAIKEFQAPKEDLRRFIPLPAAEKQPEPKDEKEAESLPEPQRQFQQDVNALQRIGAEIIGAEGNVWERRQLDVQMKMERHLNDIRNRGDTAFP